MIKFLLIALYFGYVSGLDHGRSLKSSVSVDVVVPCNSTDACSFYGHCLNNKCVCVDERTTIDVDYTCEYERKQTSVAFLLTFFVGSFGGGMFYIEQYVIGGIRLFLGLLQVCTWRRPADSKNIISEQYVGTLIVALTNITWTLVDLIIIGTNNYLDGNGVALNDW